MHSGVDGPAVVVDPDVELAREGGLPKRRIRVIALLVVQHILNDHHKRHPTALSDAGPPTDRACVCGCQGTLTSSDLRILLKAVWRQVMQTELGAVLARIGTAVLKNPAVV